MMYVLHTAFYPGAYDVSYVAVGDAVGDVTPPPPSLHCT